MDVKRHGLLLGHRDLHVPAGTYVGTWRLLQLYSELYPVHIEMDVKRHVLPTGYSCRTSRSTRSGRCYCSTAVHVYLLQLHCRTHAPCNHAHNSRYIDLPAPSTAERSHRIGLPWGPGWYHGSCVSTATGGHITRPVSRHE
jgi:hypothetical protein